MATTSNGGASLPADAAATIDAATAAATPAPAAVPSPLVPGGLPGGVSAMPIDASTWIQITIPPNPSAAAAVANVSITLTARILLANGTLSYCRWDKTFALASGLTFSSDMAPGYLLSVSLACNTAGVVDGVVYAIVGLVHQPGTGLPLDTLLISTYISSYVPGGWPCGILRTLSEGNGFWVLLAGTQPPAFSSFTYSVVDQYLKVESIAFTLVTSATVASRQPNLLFSPAGASPVTLAFYTGTQAASTTLNYVFVTDTAPATVGPTGWALCTLPPDIILPLGGSVVISVANMQAGDQLEYIYITGRAWL